MVLHTQANTGQPVPTPLRWAFKPWTESVIQPTFIKLLKWTLGTVVGAGFIQMKDSISAFRKEKSHNESRGEERQENKQDVTEGKGS